MSSIGLLGLILVGHVASIMVGYYLHEYIANRAWRLHWKLRGVSPPPYVDDLEVKR